MLTIRYFLLNKLRGVLIKAFESLGVLIKASESLGLTFPVPPLIAASKVL